MSNKIKLFVALCAAMAVSLLCVVGCAGGETKHNYSEKWETNADEHWHACADDGCSEVADKAAHTYDDGVVTKNATCSEAGEKTFTCAVCGYKKTETIVVTAHTWNNGVVTTEATCYREGVTTYTCTVCSQTKTETIDKTDHVYETEWDKNDEKHWHNCENKNNGCTAISDEAAHDWNDGVETTAATCYQEGVTTYTCTVCAQTKTETIDKTAHIYETEWDYDDENHWHNCENKNNGCTAISDEAAHDWNDGVVTTEPTFEAAGEKTFTCKECGAKKTEPVTQKAHSYAETWSSDDTHHWHACTDVGYEDTVKGEYDEHVWGAWEIVTEPTLTSKGSMKHKCTLCEKEVSQDAVLDTVYDTLYNANWKKLNGSSEEEGVLPNSWTIEDDKVLRFAPSENNTSGSFLWKFDYKPSKVGNIFLYFLSKGSWNSSGDPKDIGAFFTDTTHKYYVDLMVLNIKNSDMFKVLMTVDGELKLNENYTAKGADYRELYFYVTTGAGVLNSVVVDYDKVTNTDWKWWVTNYADQGYRGVLTDEWTITNDAYLKFVPSYGNESKSFVWTFWYKPTDSGYVNIYALAKGIWGGTDSTLFNLSTYCSEINKVYEVELKVLRSETDESKYHVYLVIDGTENDLGEKTLAAAGQAGSDPTGLYFYTQGSGIVYAENPVSAE